MRTRALNFFRRRLGDSGKRLGLGEVEAPRMKAWTTHAERYGVKRYTLKELAVTGPDYIRGVVYTAVGMYLFWDVFHDVACHQAVYMNPKNEKFHFYQPGRQLFGETGGAFDMEQTKNTGNYHGGYLFYGKRFDNNEMFQSDHFMRGQ